MSEEVDGVAASLLFCITPVGQQASSFVLRLWGGKLVGLCYARVKTVWDDKLVLVRLCARGCTKFKII